MNKKHLNKTTLEIVPIERIASKIFLIRGIKVMFDQDLAKLYGVETRVLKQQVRRNINRFPDDFMFVLNNDEIEGMVSQNVIPSKSYLGGAKPMVFTEQGVAMLSSVLRSERAVQVNIQIIRTFTRLRQMIMDHADLQKKLEAMEKKFSNHDSAIKQLFEAMRRLLIQEEQPKTPLGFRDRSKNKRKK